MRLYAAFVGGLVLIGCSSEQPEVTKQETVTPMIRELPVKVGFKNESKYVFMFYTGVLDEKSGGVTATWPYEGELPGKFSDSNMAGTPMAYAIFVRDFNEKVPDSPTGAVVAVGLIDAADVSRLGPESKILATTKDDGLHLAFGDKKLKFEYTKQPKYLGK